MRAKIFSEEEKQRSKACFWIYPKAFERSLFRRSIAHYTSQAKYRSLCRGLLTRKIKEDNEISYLVCHMEKYHKTDIAPVEQENERDENYLANNPQIDCTRTRNNYNVIKRQCSYTQHINRRIAKLDLPTKVRKDAVLMCSFVVGSAREFFKSLSVQEQEKFFADCARFFADRYGEENIISAVVHMDETTPHLHLNLIPIADGKLCAKQLFDRKALQTLQTDFHTVVGKKWNLQRGKEGSTAKHLDTMSYKVKKMKDEAVAAVLQASEAERRKEAAEQSQAHAEQATHELEEKREQLQREVAPLQAAANVAQEYNAGKRKPNKRDVPTLAADNARLKQELEYSIKDQHDVFQLYQKTERERQSLQEDAKSLRELREQAPDKLREALAIVEQRKAAKRSSPFKSFSNGWSK